MSPERRAHLSPTLEVARVTIGPHEFEPLRRFFNRGRCQGCLHHEAVHPLHAWVAARAIGDRSPAMPPRGRPWPPR